MADPNSIDDLAKTGVTAGGGGLVVALVTLVGKFLTGNRLEAMALQMAALDSKLTILIAASERRDGEWERLNAEKRLSQLEAKVEAVEKLLERVVAS